MKKYMIILLLACVAPAMAAEIDSRPNLDRDVADDLEIETLPNGTVVTRLVSRSGLIAQQFWANSVYLQGFIVVFQGCDESTYSPSAAHSGQKYEQQIAPNNRVLNDRLDILIQASGPEVIQ